ncbi:MAG: acyltransferase [Bacteroidetes bacterium]|nr:acyltransferase [Bacteroidota bacterium]
MSTPSKPHTVYFPGLNGLRAIAALLVVLGHIELNRKVVAGDYLLGIQVIKLAQHAVNVFFVLSGYLITYLLLSEKSLKGTIHLKRFYIRRILRIWPLYYLIFIFGLFVFPYIDFLRIAVYDQHIWPHYGVKILLFGGMLPQFSYAIFGGMVPVVTILWSIGVEEAFYLIWPMLVRIFKRILPVMVTIIILLPVLRWAAEVVADSWLAPRYSQFVVSGFVSLVGHHRFDVMAIGALMAYGVFYRRAFIATRVAAPLPALLSILGIAAFWSGAVNIPYLGTTLQAALYAIVIANVSVSRPVLPLENRIMNHLGKISYGIYAYHYIFILLFTQVFRQWGGFASPGIGMEILFQVTVFLTTILVASLSYAYFEAPFLRIKRKFMIVKSSNTRPTSS